MLVLQHQNVEQVEARITKKKIDIKDLFISEKEFLYCTYYIIRHFILISQSLMFLSRLLQQIF